MLPKRIEISNSLPKTFYATAKNSGIMTFCLIN